MNQDNSKDNTFSQIDYNQLATQPEHTDVERILCLIELGNKGPKTVNFWNTVLETDEFKKLFKEMKPSTLKKYYSEIIKVDTKEFKKCLLRYRIYYENLNKGMLAIIKYVINYIEFYLPLFPSESKKKSLYDILEENNFEVNNTILYGEE